MELFEINTIYWAVVRQNPPRHLLVSSRWCRCGNGNIQYKERLIVVTAMRPAEESQSQRIFQLLGPDAKPLTLVNDPVCSCTDLCRSAVTGNHPAIDKWEKLPLCNGTRLAYQIFILLTSRLAKQYQQKTCLQRLHIICAHPSSFSIGTAHIGQHFMRSESNGMPILSSAPFAAKRRAFSSQLTPVCH